jgi:hypothetical protein
MDWPKALVAELASRRCVIFLGAGASAGCSSSVNPAIKPPGWEAFLKHLQGLIASVAIKASIDELVKSKRYLDAAEVILANLPPADFTQSVRDLFLKPHFQAGSFHASVLKIDPKVVVTTNYDDIYDTYSRSGLAVDGYNVCKYYESHLVADLRSPVRLIVKAHGCVSDASKIILSRSQYFRERQHYASFYTVLDSLFLTNTVLFLGYSLSDPDIQLVLENANIAAVSRHPHYALIGDDMLPELEAASAAAFNVSFLKYPAGDFGAAASAVADLGAAVDQFRAANPY